MTPPSQPLPRIVLATAWARPALAASFLVAMVPTLTTRVEVVFAVPHEPTQEDVDHAALTLEGVGADVSRLDLSIESHSEACSKPFRVALVPPVSPAGVWESYLMALLEARYLTGLPDKPGEELHALLADFTETAPDAQPAAAAASESVSGRWSAYLGDGMALVSMRWGGRIAVPTDHVRLLGNLIETGEFEPAFTSYLQRTVRAGDVVVDVGANIGLHTVLMATLAAGDGGGVIAYEPFPENLACLRRSIAASSLLGHVQVRPVAASHQAAQVPMTVSRMWRGQGTIVRDTVEVLPGLLDDDAYQIDVSTVRLDQELGNVSRIALVKIDVEGAENLVFAGMEGLLAKNRVDRIAFECYQTHLGDDWDAFCRRLLDMEGDGWCFRLLDEEGTDYEVPAATVVEHGFFETVIAERPGLKSAAQGTTTSQAAEARKG